MNLAPEYEKREFEQAGMLDNLRLIVSRDGRIGSVGIHQDINIFQCLLTADRIARFQMRPSRRLWLQIATGALEANSLYLKTGDGLAITEEAGVLTLKGLDERSNLLIFDLPAY